MNDLVVVPQTRQWHKLKTLVLDSVSSPITRRIRRNLTRRLEALEARFPPPREPLILQIVGVSPDGSKTDGPTFIVPLPATLDRDWQRRPRWR